MIGSKTKAPWYAEGLRFACKRCGRCCSGAPGYVWVSRDEAEAIAAFVKLTPEEFSRKHLRRVGRGRSLLEHPDGDCEFLERHAETGAATGCAIHAVRPMQCRTWPFWPCNLKSEKAWRLAGRDCPGIDEGELHSQEQIEAQRDANEGRPL